MNVCPTFWMMIEGARFQLQNFGDWVHTETWQGVDIKSKPEARMVELLNYTATLSLNSVGDPAYWAHEIKPFLPWADDHFAERVSGLPLNPGNTWDKWRHGKSAIRFLNHWAQFNHTYMERLWPKYAARMGTSRTIEEAERQIAEIQKSGAEPQWGIRVTYGDLQDIVGLLHAQPLTRQAWIPLFFPEDTGIGDGGRKPCTLGYQFIVRNDQMHMYYPLRSCDFENHFRDDVYLAIRLMIWVLQELRKSPSTGFDWTAVHPGTLTIHATSLHWFINDYRKAMGQ